MRYPSPLRYPGGKSVLGDFLGAVISENDLLGCRYFEPYAGGAGAALALLQNGFVSEIVLNDADFRIYSFWRSALFESDRFIESIHSVSLTIEEWRKQQHICAFPDGYSMFEVGFAAFFMNRCNRSGVLTGAGPIGGYDQSSKWTLDARFYRDALADRITNLQNMRHGISIHNCDAVEFLKSTLPSGRGRRNVFAYLDPPYVEKGQRLYLNAYDTDSHKALSKYILGQAALPWLMSYDDCDLVRDLYSECRQATLQIRYSLQEKKSGYELIISPNSLQLPGNFWSAKERVVHLRSA